MRPFSVKNIAKFAAFAVAAAFAMSSISVANAEETTATPQPELTTMASPVAKGSVGLQMFGYNWNSIARECTTTLGPEGVTFAAAHFPWSDFRAAQRLGSMTLLATSDFDGLVIRDQDLSPDLTPDLLQTLILQWKSA